MKATVMLEALTIFQKYDDEDFKVSPAASLIGMIFDTDISPEKLSQEDRDRLGELGVRYETDYWMYLYPVGV